MFDVRRNFGGKSRQYSWHQRVFTCQCGWRWGCQIGAFWPLVATPYDGYGLHIWLLESALGKRRFYLQGVYGQAIFIDPERKIVMVQTAVEKAPGGTGIIAEGWSLFKGVVTKYGNW